MSLIHLITFALTLLVFWAAQRQGEPSPGAAITLLVATVLISVSAVLSALLVHEKGGDARDLVFWSQLLLALAPVPIFVGMLYAGASSPREAAVEPGFDPVGRSARRRARTQSRED